MRITGLASGMDINQIVDDMMRARRMPVDKLIQDRQIKEWQRDAYREVNVKMQEFRNYINDVFSRSANLNAKTVNSSNSSKVTATARSDAGDTSYTISRVEQLATAASTFSRDEITNTDGNKINQREPLYSQLGSIEKTETIKSPENGGTSKLTQQPISEIHSVTVGGTAFELDQAASTDDEWVFRNGDSTVTIAKNGEMTVEGIDVDTDIEINYDYLPRALELTTFNSNGEPVTNTFEIDETTTLNQLISNINNAKMGVNAFFDEQTGRMSLTRTETGNFNDSELFGGDEIGIGGSLAAALHLKNDGNEQGGTNAIFTINGLRTERTSNTFSINNTTFTLKDTITENEPSVTINVATDVEKVFDHVTEFINKYNEIIDFINDKLKEERHRDFRPLTEEQRQGMSEREIEMWEEKSKSGMLRNDTVLSSALSQMRMALAESVQGIGGLNQLAKIGIVTTSNYMDGGKLELNPNRTGADRLTGEERLRKAIQEDPEGLYQLFMAGSSTSPSSEQGLSRRLTSILDTSVRRAIENRAGNEFRQNHQFTLGREIDSINSRVSDQERRLQQYEDRLWRQFTAMEKAMQQANSQAEMMFSQLMQNNS
ncbi:hypothetical protein BTR23_11955 [Alkalihalophilus pseudofirmus]|nr:hypothetical protein BTR23_11955 [Alkalihalophilus pseudofirmus]